MVPFTISLPQLCTSSLKLTFKVAFRMVLKMRNKLWSAISVKERKLKCRRKRMVTGFRPPPGGPMHPMNWMSTKFRNAQGGMRSYQPLWSIHCRRISMGGWAKYFSLCGMFTSSTNITYFFNEGGPYTPLRRFSVFESIKSYNMSKDRDLTFAVFWERCTKLFQATVNNVVPPYNSTTSLYSTLHESENTRR